MLGSFRKTPDERKRYSVDYDDWLDSGETISAVVFSVSPVGAEVDAYSVSADGRSVVFFVNGGVADVDYVVTVRMTTSGGQVKEDRILFRVRTL